MPECKNAGFDSDIELVVFSVEDVICGLRIDEVQEIKRVSKITKVFHAPAYVRGVINLRGQIVTVIDLRSKFNYETGDIGKMSRIVVVSRGSEQIGLLVDNIEDAMIARSQDIMPPPSNLRGANRCFFSGVYKAPETLVAILDLKEILKKDSTDENQ